MKENNHLHTEDHTVQGCNVVLSAGWKGRQVSMAMNPQQSPHWPMIQLEILLRVSSTYPILRGSLYISESQLFQTLCLNTCLFTFGRHTGNNLNPNTFLSVYQYCENGKNRVNFSVNHIPDKKSTCYLLILLQ